MSRNKQQNFARTQRRTEHAVSPQAMRDALVWQEAEEEVRWFSGFRAPEPNEPQVRSVVVDQDSRSLS
jgi:hypothetical protein